MNKIIPKEFMLLGHKVIINMADNFILIGGNVGESDFQKYEITLQKSGKNATLCKSFIEHTYLHEIVHFVLNAIGEDELNQNEKFVDTFASVLHQILVTSKY